MTTKIGVLGLGNMGGAIAAGLLASGLAPETLFGFDPDAAKPFGGTRVGSPRALVDAVDVLIVAVKPYLVPSVLSDALADGSVDVVVSVAAGLPMAKLRGAVPASARVRLVVRAMPNTAAEVGRSMTAWVAEGEASAADEALIASVLRGFGDAVRLSDESLMHVATAVVGSAPAFAYVFAEALADGAVLEGLPRSDARRLVSGMLGSVAALLASWEGSPAELKDRVASPGGTTIAGLVALEDCGFRAATVEAISRTTRRSKELA